MAHSERGEQSRPDVAGKALTRGDLDQSARKGVAQRRGDADNSGGSGSWRHSPLQIAGELYDILRSPGARGYDASIDACGVEQESPQGEWPKGFVVEDRQPGGPRDVLVEIQLSVFGQLQCGSGRQHPHQATGLEHGEGGIYGHRPPDIRQAEASQGKDPVPLHHHRRQTGDPDAAKPALGYGVDMQGRHALLLRQEAGIGL